MLVASARSLLPLPAGSSASPRSVSRGGESPRRGWRASLRQYLPRCPTGLLPLACLLLLAVEGQAQPSPPPPPLPPLADWFLATGDDWHTSPQLYVRELGRGPDTLVLLHGGWGGEHAGLLEAVQGLEDRHHVVLYDQRGSLRSPCPDSLISFQHHIQDVERLRQALQLRKLILVGHSMGAVLASAYAQQYPHRIQHLVLLAPALLKHPLPAADQALHQQATRQHQAFMARPQVQQELDRYALRRTRPALTSREETSKFRIAFASRMLYDIGKWPRLMGGRALYQGQVDALTARTYPAQGWDYIRAFRQRAYPVSILVGDHDFIDFKNRLLTQWVEGLPGVRLRILPRAGHLLWIDQPTAFTTELERVLSRQD